MSNTYTTTQKIKTATAQAVVAGKKAGNDFLKILMVSPIVFILLGLFLDSISFWDEPVVEQQPIIEQQSIIEPIFTDKINAETFSLEETKAVVPTPTPIIEQEPIHIPTPTPVPVDDFVEKAKSLGIHNDLAVAMKQAGDEFGINPRYLLAIVLSENATSPHQAVGDSGCSFGPYQGNACAGRGRWNENWFGLDFKSCMQDYLCSSKWTANRVVNQYCGSTVCNSWIIQLSIHNGYGAPQWYINKIEKNGLRAGLTY